MNDRFWPKAELTMGFMVSLIKRSVNDPKRSFNDLISCGFQYLYDVRYLEVVFFILYLDLIAITIRI